MIFNMGIDLLVNHDNPVKLHTIPRSLLPVKLHGNVVMLSILLIVIQAIARDQETVKLLLVGMLDVQNFFHEALAVIISKLQYLHTRRKLSVTSIEWYHFPVARSMCA